jgi:chromosome segregation protein
MRLITLDLKSYGPFTGQTLRFSPEAKLHVVDGPNEAGKSCSLEAVTDLPFGIERHTCYDLLHSGNDMRVGATITARDGGSLSFRRRKGNKNTIIDAADVPLADEALLPFLGTLGSPRTTAPICRRIVALPYRVCPLVRRFIGLNRTGPKVEILNPQSE